MGLWQSELDERAADIEKKAKEIDDVLKEIKNLHGVIENTENGFRKKLKEKNEKIKSQNRKFSELEKSFLAKNSDIEAMMREFSKTEDSLRFKMTQLEIKNLELQSQQYTNYGSAPDPGLSPFGNMKKTIQHSPMEEDEDSILEQDIELVQNSVILNEDNNISNNISQTDDNGTWADNNSPNIFGSPDRDAHDQILIIDGSIDAIDTGALDVLLEETPVLNGKEGGNEEVMGNSRLFEVSQTDTEGF